MKVIARPQVYRIAGTLVDHLNPTELPQPDDHAQTGWRTIERACCLVALFLLGWRLIFKGGMSLGTVAALLLCPIWIGVIRRYRGGALLFICAGLTYLSGLTLTAFARLHHRQFSVSSVIEDSSLWIGIFAGVGVVLWARTVLDLGWISLSFGLGILLRGMTHIDEQAASNPWKFVYSVPVAIMVLGVAGRRGNKVASLVFLLLLAATSVALDARSLFGTLFLAAVMIGWQLRPRSASKPLAWGWALALIAGLAVGVYNLATSLMLEGYLGTEVQQRTEVQVQTAGSLILGGRPEMAASLALIRSNLPGLGVGVKPNIFDVMTAKAGMIKINYNPNNGYVENFMFGRHIELHSVTGDLWATFGIAGLLMVIVIAALGVRGLSHSVGFREGNGLLMFLVCDTLWNLPFSPLYSSVPMLTLMLGLALRLKKTESEPRLSSRPEDHDGTGNLTLLSARASAAAIPSRAASRHEVRHVRRSSPHQLR